VIGEIVIEELLPVAVMATECRQDIGGRPLYPEEEEVASRVAPARRKEFTTVRACARDALAGLGFSPAPILPGPLGAPIWPAGVVGSMTHCAGYRAAAVARASEICSLGVDAEPNEPLPPDVLDSVADAGERAWIAGLLATRPDVSWDRLLFSAKESVFKTWFPLTRRWLDFGQAAITVDPAARTFSAGLAASAMPLADPPLTGFSGRWLVRDGLVLTAITVSRAQYPTPVP
jgi:4'-phosphopantetheinyl transferase EntD